MDFKKIILISDTHMNLTQDAEDAVRGLYSRDQIYKSLTVSKDEEVLAELNYSITNNELQKPDLIIHAGDVGYQNIVDILQSIAPIKVVNGNCDFQAFRTIEGETTDYLYFDFDGVKISLTHVPYDLERYEEEA